MPILKLLSTTPKYVSHIDEMRCPFVTEDKGMAMVVSEEFGKEYIQYCATAHGYTIVLE